MNASHRLVRHVLVVCMVALLSPLSSAKPKGSAAGHDYPTVDRVTYVQACAREHPGNHYEMINKCSCAIDRIAVEVTHQDYTNMATASNAFSIGGERGSYMRDSEGVKLLVKRYRELQTKVKQACFVIQ
jgi:hypothetical protein